MPLDRARGAARDWWAAVAVYRDRRVLSLLFLGFSSGLPFGVLAEPLNAWLTDSGVSKTEIGLFALVSIPYSLKVLWAPLVDRLPLPVLGRRLGRRRSWALLAQCLLLAGIVLMGSTDPAASLAATAALALLVAFASASQDIVIDAYRVEILEERQLAAGAATTVFGWRIGQVGSGALGLILADVLPWPVVFALIAAMVGVGMATILLNPEPKVPAADDADAVAERARAFLQRRQHLPRRLAMALAWIYAAAVQPIVEFLGRRHWLAILAFIALYKFGDAVLAVMKVPFFLEIGFSKTEIAEVVKLFGVVAVIAGGLLGGVLLARVGILRGLLVCGVLMAASNLVFVLQAWAGADVRMLALTIAVENITTGMGTTAFVAYLSSLCNLAYTATQYALLTSLMALSRTVLSSGAGWLADRMTWPDFFIATTVAALPGLLLLLWMIRTFPPKPADDAAGGSPTRMD
jgi:PAT family beta-lactamase induction signal transducer AmpG